MAIEKLTRPPGRPRVTNEPLVHVAAQLERSTEATLREWAKVNGFVTSSGDPNLSAAIRAIVTSTLTGADDFTAMGYKDGLRKGAAEARRAVQDALAKLWGEG